MSERSSIIDRIAWRYFRHVEDTAAAGRRPMGFDTYFRDAVAVDGPFSKAGNTWDLARLKAAVKREVLRLFREHHGATP